MKTYEPYSDPSHLPRRRIITEELRGDGSGQVVFTEVDVPALSDIHHVSPVAVEVADTAAARATVDALIAPLYVELGYGRADALASAITALSNAIRIEAIARMVTAAGGMVDWPIGLFVLPPVEDSTGT